jgi:ATP-binding cassette subfamily F protein 3
VEVAAVEGIPGIPGGEAVIGASVQVGYFAQAHEGLHPEWTLLREIQNAAPHMQEGEARDYLAKFLFSGDDVFKEISVLSGGERGRLALACLSLQGANLLLLDEPTNHLDLPSQEILQRILSEFAGTVLLITHDRYLVDAVASQVWEVLPNEKTLSIFEGNYSQMKAKQAEQKNQQRQVEQTASQNARSTQKATKPDRISQRMLREMETRISELEEQLEKISKKLENPLEASESVAELGQQYMEIKGQLDTEWGKWHALFEDE